MLRIAPILLFTACSKGELLVLPPSIAWGEVDFQEDLPEVGYESTEIILQNSGKKDLDIRISGFDTTRLILDALLATEDPPTLPTIEAGSSNVIRVGVGAYELGERDSEVSGSFSLNADGLNNAVRVDWSFTPIRDIATDDTAD